MVDLVVTVAVVVAALLFLAAFLQTRWRREAIMPWETGLLYRDGAFQRTLLPGAHRFFDPARRLTVVRVATSGLGAQLGPLEVYSGEGFAFRLTLAWTMTVADARAYHEDNAGGSFAGMRPAGFDAALTAAAMAAAAARPLAQMVADPQPLAVEALAATAPAFPMLRLEHPAVTRLQLPPEMRRLFTEVETARLQGLAALERARGEQAALRSLANAARLLKDHPELAQLRLLQVVEGAKRPATIVLGGAAVGVTAGE
jgi:hypothetical protein